MISLLIDLFTAMLYKKLLSQATLVYILEYGVFVRCFIFFAVGGQKRKYVIWSLTLYSQCIQIKEAPCAQCTPCKACALVSFVLTLCD